MRKKILALAMSAILAIVPTGSVLAEEMSVGSEVVLAEIASEQEGTVVDNHMTVQDESHSAEEVSEQEMDDTEVIAPVQEVDDLELIEESVLLETKNTQSTETAEQLDSDEITAFDESENMEAAAAANLDGEVLVLDIEVVETPEDSAAEPLASEELPIADQIVTGQLAESGLASCAGIPTFSLFSNTSYVDSYGGQLDGLAKGLYDSMKLAYYTLRGTGTLEHTISTPYTFSVPDGTVEVVDGVKTLVWDAASNDEYQEICTEIAYCMQSAYDAFLYDYPEVFWMAAPAYAWGISFSGSDSPGYIGKISVIQITPGQCYIDASSEISAFMSAVDRVTAEISAMLPADATQIDVLEAIHDYLCTNVSYAENTYAHTAAGVFLKSKSVVCEGYAKAFKILCDEFGIESALVPGDALKADGSTEGHMWNCVKMADGNWYMVDTTWDDQSSIYKTYFLAGSSSQGFNAVISTERTVYKKFSGDAVNTTCFETPVLSESAYCTSLQTARVHDWDSGIVTTAATCVAEGMKTYICLDCGNTKRETLGKLTTHTWNSEKTVDQAASCASTGSKSIHCSVCNIIQDGSFETIPKSNEHTWDAGTITTEAGCTMQGVKTYTCKVCGEEKTETIPAIGHNFGQYVQTQPPTALEEGVKTSTCSRCGEKKTASIAKLVSRISVNASYLIMKKGQLSTKLRVTGLEADDYVIWSSSNEAVVYVSQNGVLKACSTGMANIYAKPAGGGASVRIPVKVQKNSVPTRTITGIKTVTIEKGKYEILRPVITPLTTTDKLTFTSKNKKVATVSKNGVVVAKGAGTTYITVKSGKKSYKVKVVVPKTKTTDITVQTTIKVKLGKSKYIGAKCYPTNSDEKLTYASFSKKTATINQKGKITGKKKGKTLIVIRSGSVKRYCTVIVY